MSSKPKFLRLEAPGYWRQSAGKPGRHVVVHLGDTSITLISKSNIALAHWSLHGIRRIDSGGIPAVYAVESGEAEVVEISDETMIDAIHRWHEHETAAPPRRFKLLAKRLAASVLALSAVAAVAYAVVREAPKLVASFASPSDRVEIGERLFELPIPEFAGHCEFKEGAAALEKLAAKLHPEEPGAIKVVDGLGAASIHLPGKIVVIDKSLLFRHDGPEAIAGHVLLERLLAADSDPVRRLISNAGLNAATGIVFGNPIDDGVLSEFARWVLTEPRKPIAEDRLLEQFAAVEFSSTPFGLSFEENPEIASAAIERDPFKDQVYPPLLSDGDWVRLQGICDS